MRFFQNKPGSFKPPTWLQSILDKAQQKYVGDTYSLLVERRNVPGLKSFCVENRKSKVKAYFNISMSKVSMNVLEVPVPIGHVIVPKETVIHSSTIAVKSPIIADIFSDVLSQKLCVSNAYFTNEIQIRPVLSTPVIKDGYTLTGGMILDYFKSEGNIVLITENGTSFVVPDSIETNQKVKKHHYIVFNKAGDFDVATPEQFKQYFLLH